MQYNINKNNKFTEKHISNLLQKNGNIFYLFSTYSTFSIVWTYNNKTYKSDFLNKIVYDIKTCKMWGVYAGQTH